MGTRRKLPFKKPSKTLTAPSRRSTWTRGYKGHGCDANIVTIDRERRGTLTRTVWKKLKHRSAIEPVIGHLKSDCRLERNYLTGEEGNAITAILSATDYNFRKLLKELVKLFVGVKFFL